MLRLSVALLLALAAMIMLPNRSLYYPDKAPVETLISARLRAWPEHDDFRGLVAEAAGAVRGTVIVFHGNAGHAGHRAFYADALTRLGLRVILAEYPGYGPRDGEPEEATLVPDAEETIARARRQYGEPIVLIGESLGAAVAAAASATLGEHVAGLLLITPWDRLETVATFHYPWLPVRWLLRERYDSAAHLASFERPVLVVVAERDSIVPARFGEALYQALPGPKRLNVIAAAGHNDWVARVGSDWWDDALSFVLGRSR